MSLIPDFEIGLWNAWIFMIWLVLSPFLSSIIIKEKEVSKKISTSAPMRHEKILNILSMAVIIFGFMYSIFLPIKFHTIFFYIGILIFLCGWLIDISVLYTLRKVNLNAPFTNGPYKYSRNPIYISILLILLSISIMSCSWIFLFILIFTIIHILLAVPAEEKYCLNKYGAEYQEYLETTPRWFGIQKNK